jgi:hypothetical protein
VTPFDREALDQHLAELARTPISQYRRNEQLAYWINLYKALTVRTVLRHYPVASISDIDLGSRRSHKGPWDAPLIEVEGQKLSLDDVQNGILRQIWRDRRIHFALSCAALSCPNLQPEPFTSDRLERQLSDVAMSYVNDPRCIQMEDRRLVVSSLFRWYRSDFGESDREVIKFLTGFAEPHLAMKLQQFDQIDGDAFDWRLNDGSSS